MAKRAAIQEYPDGSSSKALKGDPMRNKKVLAAEVAAAKEVLAAEVAAKDAVSELFKYGSVNWQ